MENNGQDIRLLTEMDIITAFQNMGEQRYRAKQVYDWIWNKQALSFEEMTNLPVILRTKLKEVFVFSPITVHREQKSSDGTIKSAFRLHDGNFVEGVLIPAEERMTACISSQVGCSLSCKFCATGKLERLRNIDYPEIFDQVVAIKNQCDKYYKQPLSNIVFMGMGEPLLNYTNVLAAINFICGTPGLAMSSKRITVSTAGIAKMIRKLADDSVKFNLALSLHAANDTKRNEIMPINEQNNLKALADALRYFHDKTKNEITFEYILFKDFNDSLNDARELISFCRKIPSKVNIIEYNPISGESFEKPQEQVTNKFVQFLKSNDINVNVRKSRGKDIDAACGQLANKLG